MERLRKQIVEDRKNGKVREGGSDSEQVDRRSGERG